VCVSWRRTPGRVRHTVARRGDRPHGTLSRRGPRPGGSAPRADTVDGSDTRIQVMTSRREFLERTALSAVALSLPGSRTALGRDALAEMPIPPPGFLDLIRPPDSVIAQTASGERRFNHDSTSRWASDTLVVTTDARPAALRVTLSAPNVAVSRVHLRWRGRMTDARLILGDAWERAYGDLEWRS